MKIKFLSIAFTFVLALALASCGGNPKPTGDPVKDAKAFVEREISLIEGIGSKDDAQKAYKNYNEMEQSFKKAYEDKAEDYAKFEEEVYKLKDGAYKEKYEIAEKKAMKNMLE